MGVQAPVRHLENVAEELVREAFRGSQLGYIVSIKATIAVVRELGPDLSVTDCELVGMIVELATHEGLFIAFDVSES
ncbi:MAG: hypothetical protein E5Y89_15800 [Mesorhizobium sp.]|nr:MAG: hypothetical protein E5Y89_15800 [Mesorhizobium sp.]